MKEETQAEMIQRILGESGRWMSAQSVSDLTELSPNTVYRTVSKLAYLGLIEKKTIGGFSHYRVKSEEPELQLAGPRTYVNGSMPNGSPKWWAQFFASQAVVR
jgi:hypothetical protein